MVLADILWAVVRWVAGAGVVKFVVFGGIFVLVDFLVPMVIDLVGGFAGVGSLNSAFSVVSSGVWYFLDFFHVDFGVPLLISAYVSRFLIRRLPVVG